MYTRVFNKHSTLLIPKGINERLYTNPYLKTLTIFLYLFAYDINNSLLSTIELVYFISV